METSSPQDTLSLIQMLLLITLPGLFGGIVSATFDLIRKKLKNNPHQNLSISRQSQWILNYDHSFPLMFFSKALIGIAGAFGAVLLGLLLGKITTEPSVTNQVYLISMCLIAGVISYQLLPKIGSKIEEHLLEQKITLTEEKIAQTEQKIIDMSSAYKEYASAIAHAETALSRKKYQDAPQAIERLENLKELNPTDRTVFILLGRLYRAVSNYDKAILVLRQYISNVNEYLAKGDIKSHQYEINLSDSYFNIACYHILKAQECESVISKEESTRLKDEALDALETSIELWSQNKEYAKKDPDFEYIKEHAKFKELIDQIGSKENDKDFC